jgi:Flp pilus assembly protein TadD
MNPPKALPTGILIISVLVFAHKGVFATGPQLQDEDRRVWEATELARTGNAQEAVAALEQIVHDHKNSSNIWYWYGFALMRAGSFDAAEKALKKSISLDGASFQARMALART